MCYCIVDWCHPKKGQLGIQMAMRIKGKNDTTLLVFLKETLTDWRPKTIKERLQKGCILVNGEVITHHAFPLTARDEVEVHKSAVLKQKKKAPFPILFQDDFLVGIHKPEGLLSVGTDRERNKHALAIVREMLGPEERLWPVHRLDRETSGVLLFARQKEICETLQTNWADFQKVYLAIVEGHLDPVEGLIDEPLYEDKSLMVRVSSHASAKDARTRYRTLETGKKRSLVEIYLETGRRHQIRAHMAFMKTPVVGDARYGIKGPRMALHAQRLSFRHPNTDEPIILESKAPPLFQKILLG
jgi:23S rRNA pseudouridine1911/1915/1917 synthase